MLGPPKLRRLDAPVVVSLDALVSTSNFYRHLDAKLDLGFVREWVQELYAERGRPSIDPVVFFKLQLVMFFEGIRSERKLIEMASLNLAHRWYLGYALDEELPDHSRLTRIRQRLGIDVFQGFFEKIVDLCQDAGLVWGRELYFDATRCAPMRIPIRLCLASIARPKRTSPMCLRATHGRKRNQQALTPIQRYRTDCCIFRGVRTKAQRLWRVRPRSTGIFWRNGVSTLRDRHIVAIGARVTSGSARPIRMLPRCGRPAKLA